MWKRCLSVIVFAAACAAIALAAHPVGYIRSSEPFRLRGATVPVAGMRWWPIVAGDDIVAGSASAALTFADGSRVTLARASSLKLESAGERTRVRLLDGSLEYRLSASPKVEIYNRDLRQAALSGSASTTAQPSTSSASTSPRATQAPPLAAASESR
jgi:hypothetical protein